MITEEDVNKITTVVHNVIRKRNRDDIQSLKKLLKRVDGGVEEQSSKIIEQNNIITDILEVVEEQQRKIKHMEEEIKTLKKAVQS